MKGNNTGFRQHDLDSISAKQAITKNLFKDVVIRSASTADLGSMTSLLQELFTIEEDFTPNLRCQRQGLARLMENPHATLLVAVHQSAIVGMCTLQPLISTAEGGTVGLVEDLVIAEPWRGKGIGSKLLAAIETIARQQNMSRLQLLADRHNEAARQFYQQQQWHETHMIVLRKKFE